MLSYHGAEHYNSVRDSSAGKPPPPSKTSFEKTMPLTVIDSEGDETEAFLETEEKVDIAETPIPDPPTNKTRPKKNDPCSCGSGLRYRKCCLESDKSKDRVRKWKTKRQSPPSSDDNTMERVSNDTEEEKKMDGNFRVLKI